MSLKGILKFLKITYYILIGKEYKMKWIKNIFKVKKELPPPLPVLDKNIEFLNNIAESAKKRLEYLRKKEMKGEKSK